MRKRPVFRSSLGQSFGHLSLRLNCAFVAVFCTPPARAGAGGMVVAASAVADVHSGNGMTNGMRGCACTPRPRLMNAHGKTAQEALVRWPCAVRKVPRRIQRPQNHRTKKGHMCICTQVAPAPVQWPCICNAYGDAIRKSTRKPRSSPQHAWHPGWGVVACAPQAAFFSGTGLRRRRYFFGSENPC